MYQAFYGLAEPPFELTSNPRFLFFSAAHREALGNLKYGLSYAKAVTLLLGEAGTGKTTLLRAALASDECRHVRCVFLTNPALTRAEFVEILAHEFGLGVKAAESKAALLSALEFELRSRRAGGEISALVVDEAQSLSQDVLEEIRLLANIETNDEKLLPLVLAGQPEFAKRLNQPDLRQLKQRVALRCEVATFTLQETASYIAGRIRVAGGEASQLFTRDAVVLIHERSHGIPRTINVICDNALLSGFALGCQPVDREVVLEVCRDFDLRRGENGGPSGPRAVGDTGAPWPTPVAAPGAEDTSTADDLHEEQPPRTAAS